MSTHTAFRRPGDGTAVGGNDNELWWEEWVRPDNGKNKTPGELRTFFNDCATRFFDEQLDRGDFFEVCCLVWIVKFLDGFPDSSPRQLWGLLKQAYATGIQPPFQKHPANHGGKEADTSGIVQWILPSPEAMDLAKLESDVDEYLYPSANTDDGALDDRKFVAYMMEFWKTLYQVTSPSFPLAASGKTIEIPSDGDQPHQRPAKRRRRGFSRFQTSGAGDLLQGSYKLPAVYLLVSVLKERAENWDMLRSLAHDLPTMAFKTFSESDIQAGLALVGLQAVSTGTDHSAWENGSRRADIEGLSSSELVREYFSQTEYVLLWRIR